VYVTPLHIKIFLKIQRYAITFVQTFSNLRYTDKATMMIKTILTLILIVSLSIPVSFSQNRSIIFVEKPWGEILAMAKKEKKTIFLDAYTSWCGPCKWMAANMFTNDSVADYYNRAFLCAHFDMEKGEGIELAKTYQVRAYPTLLFINPEGEMVHKRVGAPRQVSDYLSMGKTALTPGEGYAAYDKRYAAGERDPSFMVGYLERRQGAYLPLNEPLTQYFSTQKESDLQSRTNWEIIFKYLNDPESPTFGYFFNHRTSYSKLYTYDSVDLKIMNVFTQSLVSSVRGKNFSDSVYEKAKQKIRLTGYENAGKVFLMSDLSIYQGEKFLNAAYEGMDTWFGKDPAMLSRIAVTVANYPGAEKKHLDKAGAWARRSVELKNSAEYNDACAGVLFKLGEKEEAIRYARNAVALAKNENVPSASYEANLARFLKE
jgi:thiol-disulfide isomerase/thioredoxin